MSALRKLLFSSLAFVAFCLGSATSALADTVVFNFEATAATSNIIIHPGVLTVLPLTQSGLTATFTREGGVRFDVIDTRSLDPAFGNRGLDPFFDVGASAFLVNFSQSVTGISIDMGDFGADADTLLLQAFSGPNGTGTLLAEATGALAAGGNLFSFHTLSLTASGINSIRFIGGSTAGANSVYYDNLTVTFTPIPEPATMLLLGTGLAGVIGAARRRRKAQP